MECIELNRLSEHLKNVRRKCPQSGIRTVNEKAQPYVAWLRSVSTFYVFIQK